MDIYSFIKNVPVVLTWVVVMIYAMSCPHSDLVKYNNARVELG